MTNQGNSKAAPNWKNAWGNKTTNTTNVFGSKTTTTGGFSANKTGGFGKTTTPALDIRTNGIILQPPDPPTDPINDTISDLSVNDRFVVAAASWSGLKIWRNVPKVENNTTQSSFTQKSIPYSFESIDGDLVKNQWLYKSPNPEPILRCTFDTLHNNIIYYGNIWGQIFKVCIDGPTDQIAGHQKEMITGLKYCRDKRSIASSSSDGNCFLWDPRKGTYQCAQIKTDINCTNLDFVQNTIGICGIDMKSYQPVVKLYDIRNLSNPLPPPPKTSAFSFTKTQNTTTNTTTATQSKFTTEKPLYTEIKSYPKTPSNNYPLLRQFTSIVLDRSGTNFLAGTIGGYIVTSKNNMPEEEYFLVKHNTRSTTSTAPKTTFTTTAQTAKPPNLDENLKYKAINCLAMIQAPIRANGISAHAIFAGTSCGSVVSFNGFRSSEKQGSLPLNVMKDDYVPVQANPVTAIAVSPNGKYLAYAYGDDFREGCKYRFLTKDKQTQMKKTEIRVKLVVVSEDFKVKDGKI